MRAYIGREGLNVIFRLGDGQGRQPVGFKIKRRSKLLFSERHSKTRGFCIGPLYFGLYGKEPKT